MPIHVIAQSPDGYLWIASGDGLYRFDGVTFERIDDALDPEEFGVPRRLMIARSGAVWIWYPQAKQFAIYGHGRLSFISMPDPKGEVITLDETPDGSVWAGIGQMGRPMLRYARGRWTSLNPAGTRDMLVDTEIAPDGALWLAYTTKILRQAPGGDSFEEVERGESRARLARDPGGGIWMVSPTHRRRLSASDGSWPAEPGPEYLSEDGFHVGHAAFDADGALWRVGIDGLHRDRFVMARTNRAPGAVATEAFRVPDGLSSPSVNSVLRDRQDNMWVGTIRGLHRFSVVSIALEGSLRSPARYGDILFSASNGDVYVGQRDAVYRISGGQAPARLFSTATDPEAICEGPDGGVWIVLGDRIMVAKAGRLQRIERPQAETGIYECAVDRSGRFWLTAAGSGLYWRDGGQWRSYDGRSRSGTEFHPTVATFDATGHLWVIWGPEAVARLNGDEVIVRPLRSLETVGELRSLFGTRDGLVVTGRTGAAFLAEGREVPVDRRRVPALRNASGFVQTGDGQTWTVTPKGLTRLATSDLERAFGDPDFVPPQRLLGEYDGLPAGGNSQSWRNLALGGDGRLWVGTLAGVAFLTPSDLIANNDAPRVVISSLQADGLRIRDPAELRLRAGVSNIAIGYAVLSLTLPQRNQVRYRLEGHDPEWIDPGRRRQAFYTNLAPGTYRFRVIGANEDGVWNRDGATLVFTIPPTFMQSIWFKFLIGLALLGLGCAAYILRMRQVTAQLHERFQVRTSERERIARELHDTLLQGVQGLVLRVQSAANRLPKGGVVRTSLEETLERADDLVIEGRARLQDLRRGSADVDLGRAIAEAAAEIISSGSPQMELTVEGEQRPLEPVVADELLRIAEEALRNAVVHGEASGIEGILIYGRREVRLAIRDDGKGMLPDLVEAGRREGHFGLLGMRERAERIGGRFAVASRVGEGTEVSVVVPASRAYRDSRPFSARRWLRRLRGGEAS